ncbi:hypothetical protein LAZ67_15000530 [Cordylochernes scorpioides]|uniref:Reverse transcriptase domain-containing protein n=1 Tax=Cordylochernes scorpioides TaxID=51811 RepID=A0ABY6L987_9ARAC|nr:hypothetical protein LAZ67_15000530 [Cordylochernes scorpioides]
MQPKIFLRDRIVLGCRDTTLRENFLQNLDLTMSLAINQGQAAEASQKQLRNIEKNSIDAIKKNFNEKDKPTTSLKNSYTSNPEDSIFYFVQQIQDNFHHKPTKSTIAAFIDLSQAFDRVWKEKLILKLKQNLFCIRCEICILESAAK